MAEESQPPDILQNLSARKQRCQRRLEVEPSGYTYFAIIGADLKGDHCSIGDRGFIREVEGSPNEFELAATLSDKTILSAVHRYSASIRHELVLRNHPDDLNATFAAAWAVAAALRIRTVSDFLVPLAAAHSWSTMAALPPDSCSVWLIEDVPKARRIGWQRAIRSDDCEWVEKHFHDFASLQDEPKFRLAADLFSTHAHHANLRMSTASLWAGIEALFEINLELRFRISALAATVLEPRGEARLALYRRLKSLYDFRSKAVHGGDADDEQLSLHITEVRFLLSRLLVAAIENGRTPTTDEIENSLFSLP